MEHAVKRQVEEDDDGVESTSKSKIHPYSKKSMKSPAAPKMKRIETLLLSPHFAFIQFRGLVCASSLTILIVTEYNE